MIRGRLSERRAKAEDQVGRGAELGEWCGSGQSWRPGVGNALRQREAEFLARARPAGTAKWLSERRAGDGGVRRSRASREWGSATGEDAESAVSTRIANSGNRERAAALMIGVGYAESGPVVKPWGVFMLIQR
jgi:hypothetical protein